MDIGYYLTLNARNYPTKRAIHCEGREYTYEEFNEQVNRLAHGLLDLGVQKGDKIALMMKNSDFFVFAYFASAKIGAVVVPINFRLTAPEVHYILDQSDTQFVFCDQEYEAIIQVAKKQTAVKALIVVGETTSHVSFQSLLSDNKNEPEVVVLESDDLEILYTSGTTGQPKGALFDHRRIFNVGLTMMVGMGINQNDRFLHLAPLFHSAQLNLFLVAGVILGATHVIHREFHPVQALQAIEDERITHFFGVPAMYNFILQVPNKEAYDLSSIKRCGYGAAPMPPEIVKQSMKFFQTDQFYNLCGLTEGGPGGIMLDPEGHKYHLGKGGKPIFLTEVKVVDSEGKETPPGMIGEFVIRGETVMKEYYKKPEETKRALKDGWLYTGDLAVADEEGYMTLVDRKKDMIISGGENVYSIEVEQVMYEHPSILEAATIGLPDEVWGEMVTAIVVLKPNATFDEEEFRGFCRQKLAGYKVPRQVIVVDELPRNTSGKILKYQLRQRFHQKM
ncbi:class I adenylate-forming enzyme family protein [Bacillus sp. FJAT-42315]|uniref:class I adenylate-forming enzyme family protein n=1 Tax=Bacillus sp. FJAT-42315 TaxID=2014077 RepID=UPI000C250651|nr:long-chain fatty acid--CoA ligase [Bacillus sp. FJAT-42315]